MVGQRMVPRGHHPFADLRPEAEVAAYVANVRQVIAKCVQVMPTQAEFIAEHCQAGLE
jgi:tryptophan halogenase